MIEWTHSPISVDSLNPFESSTFLLPSLHHSPMEILPNTPACVGVPSKRSLGERSRDFADRTFQAKKPSFRMSKTTLFLFTLMQTIRLLWITLAIALFSCASAKRLTADECKGMSLCPVVTI